MPVRTRRQQKQSPSKALPESVNVVSSHSPQPRHNDSSPSPPYDPANTNERKTPSKKYAAPRRHLDFQSADVETKEKRRILGLIQSSLQYYLVQDTGYPLVTLLMLCIECCVCVAIINTVKYTEIDWSTYMQQVQCFLSGTRDYQMIKGDTGPIVYPAGHLYVYSALYYVTEQGTNVLRAQYIFMCLYLFNAALVYSIYQSLTINRVPPYLMLLSSLCAYRVHSIWVLRLFNDPLAMVLLYCAVLALCKHKHVLTAVSYSLAVSIKMNILLMAPGLAVLWVVQLGWTRAFGQVALCALIQVLLGAPFLWHNWQSYVTCAFNLGRVFLYEWTVNWRFVSEPVFLSRLFHGGLLAMHICLLLVFASFCWLRYRGGTWKALRMAQIVRRQLTNDEMVYMLFTANLLGLACARSLHYQFYVWYHAQLPYLLCTTALPAPLRVCVLLGIELCWNVFPSTVMSSACLCALHGFLLTALLHECRRRTVGL